MDSPPSYANIEPPPPAYHLSDERPPNYDTATQPSRRSNETNEAENTQRPLPSADPHDIISTLRSSRTWPVTRHVGPITISNYESYLSTSSSTIANVTELPALTRTPTPYPRVNGPERQRDLESGRRSRRSLRRRPCVYRPCCCVFLFVFVIVATLVSVSVVSSRLDQKHMAQTHKWCELPDGSRCPTKETASREFREKYGDDFFNDL